ncbi:MAG: hypothetical protein EPN93_18600 [Spirochaetes bacterium]|nr:MAG: hypothetical protein EPN93_18600 [Spirochaetota bacterium]
MRVQATRAIQAVSILLALCAVFGMTHNAAAEIVYLKNGSVVKGTIVRETRTGITLKDGDREREIPNADITRVMYGNMDMEEVYILGMDGSITREYMVDQDKDAITVRDKPDSPAERTILRRDIREISRDAHYPVDLEFYMKPAAFVPLDSGRADLKTTGQYTLGMGFNSMMAPNLRLMFETGFLRSESGTNSGQSLRIVPVTLSLAYNYFLAREFTLIPKLGGGLGISQFETGEGDVMKSNLLAATAGCGLMYRPNRGAYSFGLWAEYAFFFDGASVFQAGVIGMSCGYRL